MDVLRFRSYADVSLATRVSSGRGLKFSDYRPGLLRGMCTVTRAKNGKVIFRSREFSSYTPREVCYYINYPVIMERLTGSGK